MNQKFHNPTSDGKPLTLKLLDAFPQHGFKVLEDLFYMGYCRDCTHAKTCKQKNNPAMRCYARKEGGK